MGTTESSLAAYWLPFTPNRHFKSAPRIVVRAKDMHYTTDGGREILDGTLSTQSTNVRFSPK
jgi:beta-alanine--pyruvate transaminase